MSVASPTIIDGGEHPVDLGSCLSGIKGGLEALFARKRNSLEGHLDETTFRAISEDITAIRNAIDLCTGLMANETPAGPVELKRALLDLPISAGVRVEIEQVCGILATGLDELKTHHLNRGVRAAGELAKYKYDSNPPFVHRFFDNMLAADRESLNDKLGENEINGLMSHGIRLKAFGDRYKDLPHMLFAVMGDSNRVARFIMSHIRPLDGRANVHNVEAFDSMLAFLSKFAYVSEAMIDGSGFDESKAGAMRGRSQAILEQVVRDNRLVHDTKGEDTCFTIFEEVLGKLPDNENPWIAKDLGDTPYSAKKIAKGMNSEYSPRILAAVVAGLNGGTMDNLRPRDDINAVFQGNVLRLELTEAKKVVSDERLSRLFYRNTLKRLFPQLNLKQKRKLMQSLGKTDEEVSGMNDQEVIDEFDDNYVKDGRVNWHDVLTGLEVKDGEFNRDGTKFLIGPLSRTLSCKEDPFLDIPGSLDQQNPKKMRSRLMALAADVLPGEDMNMEEWRRVCPPVEGEIMVKKYGDSLKRYFNSAKEGLARPYLFDRARAMIGIYDFTQVLHFAKREVDRYFGGDKKYEIGFFASASKAFDAFAGQSLPPRTQRGILVGTTHEYRSITEHFEQGGGSRLIPINHGIDEIKTFDELLADFKAEIDGANHEAEAQGKLGVEMVFVSSATRFGDMISDVTSDGEVKGLKEFFAEIKAAYPDITVASDLCQDAGRVSMEGKRVADMGADLYLFSCNKAVGAGLVGGVMVSKAYNDSLPENRKFKLKKDSGTEPLLSFAALGLALQDLRLNDDLFKFENNIGSLGSVRLDEKISEDLIALTKEVIEIANNYGDAFVDGLKKDGVGQTILSRLEGAARGVLAHDPVKPGEEFIQQIVQIIIEKSREGVELSDLESGKLGELVAKEIFRCDVVAPVHRDQAKYTGIVTLAFPNIRGPRIGKILEEDPEGKFVVLTEPQYRWLRLALDYWHTEEDLGGLFNAILNGHLARVKRKYAAISDWQTLGGQDRIRYVETTEWADNPNIPDRMAAQPQSQSQLTQ